jgi:two-component system, NarL family, sensor kinase
VDAQLNGTRQLIDELTDQMRGVADTLYPGTIAEFGLLNALHALGRLVARRSNVAIDVDAGPFHTTLSPSAAGALYRVADEALRNVAQHSRAQRARVLLRADHEFVRLEVEDDGCGVDMTAGDPLQAGLGLFSARAVLALSGGELQISGAPGRGTCVTAQVPTDSSKGRTWRTT